MLTLVCTSQEAPTSTGGESRSQVYVGLKLKKI